MACNTWDQTASKLDAFTEAVILRKIITKMILRDFGLKREKFDAIISRKTRERYPELKPVFERVDNYQNEVEKARLLKEYDDYFVKFVRDNLFQYTKELVADIAAANEVKAEIEEEYKKRILHQDDAIGDIAKIRQEVLFIEEFFAIDLRHYMNYSEQLELTKNYLYRWKKSTLRDYDEFLHPEKKAARLAKEKVRQERRRNKRKY